MHKLNRAGLAALILFVAVPVTAEDVAPSPAVEAAMTAGEHEQAEQILATELSDCTENAAQPADCTTLWLMRNINLAIAQDWAALERTAGDFVNFAEAHLTEDNEALWIALELQANAWDELGKSALAEANWRRLIKLRQTHRPKDQVSLLNSREALARNLENQQQLTTALAIGEEVLAMARKMPDDSANRLTNRIAFVAGLHYALGLNEDAATGFGEVLQRNEREFGADAPEVATSLNNLGNTYSRLGRYKEAETALRRALAIRKERLDQSDPLLAYSYANLATNLDAQGRFVEAERNHRQALAIRLNLAPSEDERLAESYNNLGINLLEQGRLDDARGLLTQALDVFRKRYPDGGIALVRAYTNLGSVVEAAGDATEAGDYYRAALTAFPTNLSNTHPMRVSALNNYAVNLEARGQLDEATRYYRQIVAMRRDTLHAQHPQLGDSLNILANALARSGQSEEAGSTYREAYAIRSTITDPAHPDRIRGSWNLGHFLYANRRNLGEALTLYRQASTGVVTRIGNFTDFGPDAKAELNAYSPMFFEVVALAWQLAEEGRAQ